MLRHWQLVAAVIWACFAVFLFVRESVLAPGQFDGPHWDRAAWVTAALALWNLFRWYASYSANREIVHDVEPLKPQHIDAPNYEYNADLDFQKMDREGMEPHQRTDKSGG